MLLQLLGSADIEDLVGDDRSVGQLLPLLHEVALVNDDVLADRDEVLLLLVGLGILDDHAAFATHARAEIDHAINLGDLGGILRPTGLEQLGDTRQTAGDVLRLRHLSRSLREQRAAGDFLEIGRAHV